MPEKTDIEEKFEEYREYLHREAQRLCSYIAVYRRLNERKQDRLKQINIAPAFFGVTLDALFSVIVIGVHKLLDEHSERGFFHFLAFLDHNRNVVSIEELKRRRGYSDDHWMLKNMEEVTHSTIIRDKERIGSVSSLPSFKLRRDKFHAHYDKQYFTDRSRLQNDAPLKWGDLEEVPELMYDLLNKYSVAYDGSSYGATPVNINDVDYLLDKLHRCNGALTDKRDLES